MIGSLAELLLSLSMLVVVGIRFELELGTMLLFVIFSLSASMVIAAPIVSVVVTTVYGEDDDSFDPPPTDGAVIVVLSLS
jgi:hypothetical protein